MILRSWDESHAVRCPCRPLLTWCWSTLDLLVIYACCVTFVASTSNSAHY